jgi:hypothetical protein
MRKFTTPNGKSIVAGGSTCKVYWEEAAKHACENIGTNDAHVLMFEWKESKKTAVPQK